MFMPEPFAFSMVVPLAVPGSDRGTYFIDLNKVVRSPFPTLCVTWFAARSQPMIHGATSRFARD